MIRKHQLSSVFARDGSLIDDGDSTQSNEVSEEGGPEVTAKYPGPDGIPTMVLKECAPEPAS